MVSAPVRMTSITSKIGMRPVRAEARRRSSDIRSGCAEHPDVLSERRACAEDFAHFLPHWRFKNRETGEIISFANLWEGQQRAVEQMKRHRWLFLLKAGKLGFTELACAYDGWVALYRQPNARVHILSMNLGSAKDLLSWVRFGITHLPPWLGLPLIPKSQGGDKTVSFTLYGGVDDERRVISYPAVRNAAIDQTATHTHLDELARMQWPYETWSAVESTVAPGGSVHIVTRGAGDSNATRDIWEKAMTGEIPMYPHFEPWTARPRIPEVEDGETLPEGVDLNAMWYQQRAGSMLPHQLNWLAPATAEDALRGSSESQFVPEAAWAMCYEPDLPPLIPGDRTPLVVGVDAGVSNDYFAIAAVSRHPQRPQDPAVRAVRVWKPQDGEEIDFLAVERFLRILCVGGCIGGWTDERGRYQEIGHPNRSLYEPSNEPGCPSCAAGLRVPGHNVVQIAYDKYQLVEMMQRIRRDNIVWCEQFDQGGKRAEADGQLRQMIMTRRLAHGNFDALNEHVRNANAQTAANEDTRLRIVKRHPGAKIDALVATSMAAYECLRLVMENAA